MSTDTNLNQRGHVLLPIARTSIETALGKASRADEQHGWLQEPGATFVTLTQNGELRGCIGTLEARRTLLQDIKANAQAAAFQDPRFAPLAARELEFTEVEVSLLSAMQPLQFASEDDVLEELQPGIQGVVFEYGRYRSTFLPQVWEQLPQVGEFMAHLKYKAGLSPDFWADEVRISTYTVAKWKESDFHKVAESV